MLRVVVLLNAVALNLYRAENFVRPVAGAVVVGGLVVWTAVALVAYADARRRTPLLLGTDLAVAVLALASSPLLKGEGFNASVPGFWVMGVLFAWGVHWHLPGGLAAGVTLAGTDLLVRDGLDQTNYGNAFLLLIGGPIVGLMAGSLQRMAGERDRAQREAAAAAERARLARAVHDGVLQVLALVQRRGAELGGEAAELGRLAGEQEAVLRTLIRAQDAVPAAGGPGEQVDVAAGLAALETATVGVAVPGAAVPLDAHASRELVAAVQACLDNVGRHAPGARAWVLLESLPDRVEVSVRDDGPGIPEGRLDTAQAEGRLGVAQSIRGRLHDLGGTATLETGSWGTEWQLVVPKEVTA